MRAAPHPFGYAARPPAHTPASPTYVDTKISLYSTKGADQIHAISPAPEPTRLVLFIAQFANPAKGVGRMVKEFLSNVLYQEIS